MGGIKRKIKIEKIEKKTVKSVAFTKRRNGLFRKATELCLQSPNTQVAILATPPSSKSHASFYSFGHSSVDHVVSSLLNDHSPLPITNQEHNMSAGLGFWWEDEALINTSENVQELKDAIDAVSMMLNNVKLRLDDVVKSTDQRDHGALVIHDQEDTLQLCNTNYGEATYQVPNFEGASGSGSQNLQLCNTTTNNNVEDTTTQTPNFEGASGSGTLVHNLQLYNTITNNNEEATNQITNFEGASGSASGTFIQIGEDNYYFDDILNEIDPL